MQIHYIQQIHGGAVADDVYSDDGRIMTVDTMGGGGGSIITDLFAGLLKSSISCPLCMYNSITFDPFFSLCVPVQSVSIEETLNISSSDCIGSGRGESHDNIQFISNTINKFLAKDIYECLDMFILIQKYLLLKNGIVDLWWLPSYLIICLKQFGNDGTDKYEHFIDYPLTDLDLSSYIRGTDSLDIIVL